MTGMFFPDFVNESGKNGLSGMDGSWTEKNGKTSRQFSHVGRFTSYAHGESNPNRRNRNPIFYPLNYGRVLAGFIMQN